MTSSTRQSRQVLGRLDKQWRNFFSEWSKARKGKQKAVHDLRVTARRIVASLEILAELSEQPSIARLRRRLKEIISLTGNLRDLQVMEGLLVTLPVSERGSFRKRFKDEEEKEIERVRDHLEQSERRSLAKKW